MGERYDQREAPILGQRTRVEKQYTATGPIYVPVESDIEQPQEIRRETKRRIRRHVLTDDGRQGIEETEEHDVEYGPAHPQQRVAGGCATGFTAFIIICLVFTALGGSDQSMATIPLYWLGFAGLWWWLAR